jgi:methyl-accepting chemotaxis protein
MNWTFGRKLAVGFAIAGVTLLLVGISGYRSTMYLIENSNLVEHTHTVRTEIAKLLALLTDAETGQRGFTIAGEDSFLAPHQAAVPEIEQKFSSIQMLTSDNQRQQQRLARLRPLIDRKLDELKVVIELRRSQGAEAAIARVKDGTGKELMDQIRAVSQEIDDEEVMLLAERAKAAEESSTSAKTVILWGSVLGSALVAFAGFLIARSLTQQVGSAVRHIQASSTELQAASNQQATGAREQATAMSEITTTISELLATSRQIADSARRVAEIAEQTSTSARGGEGTVIKGRDAIAGIRRQVDAIVSQMLELGKKSQQIGAVLDIVSELAEQTNILAINATIEAAGAGEAGKRFGVVADEIRKLADRVGGSTKEIRNLIDDVRSSVNSTVMTTETGSKAVEAGAEQFGGVATAFGLIVQQVSTATEAAKEIELSTKQQATAVEQVNVAVTNVAQASKESEVSTGQTLRTASELSQLSQDLLRLVQAQDKPVQYRNASS